MVRLGQRSGGEGSEAPRHAVITQPETRVAAGGGVVAHRRRVIAAGGVARAAQHRGIDRSNTVWIGRTSATGNHRAVDPIGHLVGCCAADHIGRVRIRLQPQGRRTLSNLACRYPDDNHSNAQYDHTGEPQLKRD